MSRDEEGGGSGLIVLAWASPPDPEFPMRRRPSLSWRPGRSPDSSSPPSPAHTASRGGGFGALRHAIEISCTTSSGPVGDRHELTAISVEKGFARLGYLYSLLLKGEDAWPLDGRMGCSCKATRLLSR
jgi:hypothetical protein